MDRLRVVLVGVEGAINLGMIARLAKNFAADELVLVSPKASLDEAREYAARGVDVLDRAVIVGSLDEALNGSSISVCTSAIARSSDVLRTPVTPEEAASILASTPGTAVLVFGRESVGLTRSELSRCTLLSTIPASSEYPTLNLAASVAIYLYEVYKARWRDTGRRIDPRLVSLFEAYARALARVLVEDERRREAVVIASRRIAAKGYATQRELEHILYLLSRACRKIPGCRVEVAAEG